MWPLQLVGDQVNKWDLGVKDWCELLRHFRAVLPEEVQQLVLKIHPLTSEPDLAGLDGLLKTLPNTILLPKQVNLVTLLREARAVAGVNSSVLYEARLMHHKPTYCYGRSWFSNHTELFLPVLRHDRRPLPRIDWLGGRPRKRMRTAWLDDYTDWFLAQLLARQFDRTLAEHEPAEFKKKVWHFGLALLPGARRGDLRLGKPMRINSWLPVPHSWHFLWPAYCLNFRCGKAWSWYAGRGLCRRRRGRP